MPIRFKRFFSFLLTALLLFSLAGCNSPTPDPTMGTTTNAPTTTTPTGPQPTTEPVDTPKKLTIMVCNSVSSLGYDFNRREESNVWGDLKEMLGDKLDYMSAGTVFEL